METLEAIRTKRAVRQYTNQAVPEETIRKILDAGRKAQSSRNSQPWQFLVIRERQTLVRLADTGGYAAHLAEAAFAVVMVSSTNWAFDIGQSAAYLQLAAWDLGVSSCIASIWKTEQAKALLGIPADQYLEIALAFGYAAQPVPQTARPEGRHKLDDVVRWEHW